jgi:hypothetical protein
MSNAAVFDFDTIRRNMVGNGRQAGPCSARGVCDVRRVEIDKLGIRTLRTMAITGMKQHRLVESGHDWRYDDSSRWDRVAA